MFVPVVRLLACVSGQPSSLPPATPESNALDSTTPAPYASLHWDAPAECPSQDAVWQRVRSIIGRRNPTDNHHVAASVTYDEDTWRLHVVSDGVSRTTFAPSCAELAEATAWITAFTIDPSLTSPSTEDIAASEQTVIPLPPGSTTGVPTSNEAAARSNEAVAPTADVATPTTATRREPDPVPVPDQPAPATSIAAIVEPTRLTSSHSSHVSLHALTQIDLGVVPNVGYGIGTGLAYETSRWSTDLTALYRFASSVDVPDSTAQIRVHAWGAAWSGAKLWTLGRHATMQTGGTLHAAALIGRGVGVDYSSRRARPWLAVGPYALATWSPTSTVSVFLRASVHAALLVPQFTVLALSPDQSTHYAAARFGGAVSLGINFFLGTGDGS